MIWLAEDNGRFRNFSRITYSITTMPSLFFMISRLHSNLLAISCHAFAFLLADGILYKYNLRSYVFLYINQSILSFFHVLPKTYCKIHNNKNRNKKNTLKTHNFCIAYS